MSGVVIFRTVLVVLLAVFTACLIASSLRPLFRKFEEDLTLNAVIRVTYYYWYVELERMSSTTAQIKVRQYMRDSACDELRPYYLAACAFSVIAIIMGGLATVIGVAWISVRSSAALSITVFTLTAIAFVCSTVVLGLMATAYRREFCSTEFQPVLSLAADGYRCVEGFILMAVAMAGFTVVTVLQVLGFGLGLMTGKDERAARDSEMADREPAVNRLQHTESSATEKNNHYAHASGNGDALNHQNKAV